MPAVLTPGYLERFRAAVKAEKQAKALDSRWKRYRRRNPLEPDEVIAWDGEGWGHPRNVYGLLANSLGLQLVTPDLTKSLKTRVILDNVWRTGVAYPQAYQVMYGASYDWNHWLNDIDQRTAEAIQAGHPVTLAGFEVSFNGIWFEIRKQGYWVTIWDVWKFWGCGFEQAVRENLPDFHGLEVIKEFKGYRADFQTLVDAGRLPEIMHYNNLELEALVQITLKMFANFEEARIRRPRALTGAGAVAGSLITQHQVTQHLEAPPPTVKGPVLRANFGGRIEAWRYGVGEVWLHDIRSAYPYAMGFLPSLKGGEWELVEGDQITDDWATRVSLWQVDWGYGYEDGMETPTHRAYPFPYRDKGGSVQFPPSGHGWYWWPEVITARSLGFEFKVRRGWVFHPAQDKTRPYGWMKLRYEQRRLLKAQGREGAARLVKNGLNATWGKTAQARGYTEDQPPAQHSLIVAGWTTSHCRATILEAASQDWDSVVYMMTDSVCATRKLDLVEGDGLGEWEVKHYAKAMVLQAGVTFLWDEKGERIDKYRGFDKGSITPEAVIRAWKANIKDKKQNPLLVPASRPVTLGSALTNEEWFAKWNTWQEHWRELNLYGGDGKRWAPTWEQQKPWRRLEPLRPFGLLTLADEVESAPFEPRWEDADPRGKVLVDGVLLDTIDDEIVAGSLA